MGENRLGRLDALFGALFALLFAAFAAVSWQKWALLTADSARELYVPFQIRHGATIYQDFYYLYGPLAPYFNAGLLSVFGDRLEVLYLAGLANTALVMTLLYLIARELLKPLPSAVAVFLFFTHFALGKDIWGYVWPYAFAATYAVSLGLVLVLALVRHARTQSPGYLLLAGAAVGLSAVTKLEYGAAAVALAASYMAGRLLLRRSLAASGPWWKEAACVAAPAAVVSLPVVWAVLSRMSVATVLESVWPVELMKLWSSGGKWYGTAASWAMNVKWLALELALAGLAIGHRRLGHVGLAVVAMALVGGAFLARGTLAFYWQDGYRYWMSPGFLLLFAVLAGVGALMLGAWRRREAIDPRWIGWAVIAGYGCLVAVRTLMLGYNDYTRYQAPVALLVWVAAFGVWAPAFARARGWLPAGDRVAVTGLALVALALGARHVSAEWRVYTAPHVAVSSAVGTVLAERAMGEPFNQALEYLKAHLEPGDRIVAAPMEASFYLFAGRDNVLKEDQLFYGYLVSAESQRSAIARMRERGVRYIIVSNYGAFNHNEFGQGFMRVLGAWVNEDCRQVATYGDETYRLKIYETPFRTAASRR